MKAILLVVVTLNGHPTSQSFEIDPLAEQNAYDHCVDVAKQVKKDLEDLSTWSEVTRVRTSCIDKGEPNE